MKKSLVLGLSLAGLFLAGTMTTTFAEDKKVTISGDGKCAKCALKETESCQNAIQTEESGKKVTYYLAKNKVSDDFHKNLCKTTEKVKATGIVKEVNGKKELTADSIEVVAK